MTFCICNLRDAIDNRTDGQAKRTSGAIISHSWDVGVGIKGDRLISGIRAGHIALAAIYTHVLEKDNK